MNVRSELVEQSPGPDTDRGDHFCGPPSKNRRPVCPSAQATVSGEARPPAFELARTARGGEQSAPVPKKHLCFWPNLRHQPKTAFSLYRPFIGPTLKVAFGSTSLIRPAVGE